MSVVDPGYGAWLKSDARFASAHIVGSEAAWGDKAITSSNISCLAYKSDAEAEAVRQSQFLSGPTARDIHVVKGQRSDLIGQVIRLVNNRMGYENGADVFVIGAAEAERGGTTTLTVLKRL